jgi:hypothetical protein
MGMEIKSLEEILADHLARYPRLQAVDVYKLLHQAALGNEHAVWDEAGARRALECELAGMGSGPAEPLIDPISPDGRLARLHLRPWVQAGGDPQALWQAFIRTAKEWQGSPALLDEYSQRATDLARRGQLPFAAEELEACFLERKAQGYPAVHHSETYRLLYRPAYRVVARDFLEGDPLKTAGKRTGNNAR